MYTFWSFFTRKRQFSFLLVVVLIIFGTYSIFSIPKESAPEVKIPIGVVSTALPGASAADMERLVTSKIESGVQNSIEGIKKITSSSREGLSVVTVEFEASADIDSSIQDLKDRIDTVAPDLPTDATDPRVIEVDFVNQPVITFAIATDAPPQELVSIAESVEDEITTLSGVSEVSIGGFREREVQIIVSREALEQFNLRLIDVAGAISQANTAFPVGNIEIDEILYNIQFEGDINDPKEIEQIAILTKGGEPVYIGDIAVVVDGLAKETTLSRLSLDGNPSAPALSINVFKSSNTDITTVTSAVVAKLDELKAPGGLLDGVDTLIVMDSGEMLLDDLLGLTFTGGQTVLLVVVVLLFAIGWREALIAGLAIPLSFTIAFIALLYTGNTLNFVSLFALILAVGILVDSAIVMIEGINRKMKENPEGGKIEAALSAVKSYHTPLTAGTLTTVAVFLPLFFISGITGEFIASIPFTIIFVLLASLLVALGFVPLISSIFLHRHSRGKFEEHQTRYARNLEEWYKGKIRTILGNRKRERLIVWGATLLFFITITFPAIGLVKVEFFPVGDQDFILAEVELPEGSTLAQTDFEVRKLEEILYEYNFVESFLVTTGQSSPYTGEGGSNNTKFANAFINLEESRSLTSGEIAELLRNRVAAIGTSRMSVSQISSGPPVGSPIGVTFYGEDLEALERVAEDAADIVRSIEGTADVSTSAKNDGTQFVVSVDTAKAAQLGLNSSVISQTLRSAVQGTEATTIKTQDEDIAVVVKLNLNPNYLDAHDTNRVTVDALEQLSIETGAGPVLLGSVLETSLEKNSAVIVREDLKRTASLSAGITPEGNVAEINAEFERRAVSELQMPEGVTMQIGGENEENEQAFMDMFYALIVGLLLMLSILVLQFNSYRHALYVLSVTPLALIGIMIGLTVTGKALSFPTLMGFIALTGIVVNNSIIMIDTINGLRRENPKRDIRDVVVEGSASRLRPILLTTITTVIGVFPLTYADELWAPLAWSIIFGLLFSVFLTLLLVPILYERKPGTLE